MKGMARGAETWESRYDVDPETGCFIWMKTKGDVRTPVKGYGKWRCRHAHVVALENKLGRPLREGYEACHTCDRAQCVNPEHLYEGTHSENIRDVAQRNPGWMAAKARTRAEQNRSPFKKKQVSDLMKRLHAEEPKDKWCECGRGPFTQRSLTCHKTTRHRSEM